MSERRKTIAGAINAVESFFDRLKLSYKWRFNRWHRLAVLPYRGHGTLQELYLRGRVLDDRGVIQSAPGQSLWDNIRDTIRRIETDEVPEARVRLIAGGRRLEAVTDQDGYFEFRFPPEGPLPEEESWYEVDLELLAPCVAGQEVRVKGYILVPQPDVEFGVISDLDDTVLRTGATNTFQMVRTVLLNNAHTRVPFEGIAAFYRALQQGPDGRGQNPIFYISSSPWNLYDLFEGFMEAHDIPSGPLFLKDFGFSGEKLFKTGHLQHKVDRIRILLETYPDLPFVLIGDSGQQDPEVYRDVVRAYPGRIRAIYIRDVSPPARDAAVHRIAEEVGALGVPMTLAEETVAAARHAADHGLITEAALREVEADKRREAEQKKEPRVLEKALSRTNR